MKVANLEFYNSPDGEVMIKAKGEAVRVLQEKDQEIVQELLISIRDRYPEAFKSLSELYSKSERNRLHFEYRIVHRFIRCNFGEYDQYNYDIDKDGSFQFEEVKCPLRGECHFEGIICKPKLNSKLTDREIEVLKLISDGMNAHQIALELSISYTTVNRHRENIKAKLQIKNIAELGKYYCKHFESK